MFTRPKVTKPRDRDVISSRPRRDRDVEPSRPRRDREVRFFQTLKTETRPRRSTFKTETFQKTSRDRDYIPAFWVLWCNGKITCRCTDNPAGMHPIHTILCPPLSSPPFLLQIPFLLQPSQFIGAWDGHEVCWHGYPVAHEN